ncbi:MAG TPA: hypothetical protein VFZ26_17935 [Gemmatimonadales bacterium]
MSTSGAARRRGSGAALAAAALCALSLAAAPAGEAQGVTGGRVLQPGAADTTALAGVRVVLHRVGTDVQGPIDSMLSGAGGRFLLRYVPDTGAVFLLSARRHGIEYFSRPLAAEPDRPDTGLALLVYDTSSTAPITLAARHLVIPRPGEGGGREVIDLIVLRNAGHLARVAPDSLGASWSLPLPPGSEGLEVGESDVSSEAVTRRGDTLLLAAPVGPGEKQLSLQYHLPGGMAVVAVPVGAGGGLFNVLVEETGSKVTGPGLAPADTQVVLGRTFRRWSGEVPDGALIRVELPLPGGHPAWLLAGLVGAVALALAAAAWRARTRGPRPAPTVQPPASGEELLQRLAGLDATYAGREGSVPDHEWREYLTERARLKAELEAALAAARGRE